MEFQENSRKIKKGAMCQNFFFFEGLIYKYEKVGGRHVYINMRGVIILIQEIGERKKERVRARTKGLFGHFHGKSSHGNLVPKICFFMYFH